MAKSNKRLRFTKRGTEEYALLYTTTSDIVGENAYCIVDGEKLYYAIGPLDHPFATSGRIARKDKIYAILKEGAIPRVTLEIPTPKGAAWTKWHAGWGFNFHAQYTYIDFGKIKIPANVTKIRVWLKGAGDAVSSVIQVGRGGDPPIGQSERRNPSHNYRWIDGSLSYYVRYTFACDSGPRQYSEISLVPVSGSLHKKPYSQPENPENMLYYGFAFEHTHNSDYGAAPMCSCDAQGLAEVDVTPYNSICLYSAFCRDSGEGYCGYILSQSVPNRNWALWNMNCAPFPRAVIIEYSQEINDKPLYQLSN